MKKLAYVIPIMILVAIIAMRMLAKDYSEIDLPIRLVISAGAAVLSGGIAYFLFNADKGKD
ncbi:histidine kinase [Cytobacillus sp. FJAT-53684]|uniref:Histidine kinase n=1 Tax=Cytobacillus mangrovibacter TaxID=3299024 RepID=A0ABW6K2N6_9BACI